MQYTITGNTYAIRDIAKEAGFSWSGSQWIGNQDAADRWALITGGAWRGSYCNRARKANVSIVAISSSVWTTADMVPANSIY